MKVAGRRQSKNIIDKMPGRSSFAIYGNRMTVGEQALNKSNLQKHIDNKTTRVKKK